MSEPPTFEGSSPARPTPLVINVPPPKVAAIDFAATGYALLLFLTFGLGQGLIFGGRWGLGLAALFAANLVGTCWSTGRRHRSFNRRRNEFLDRHENWNQNSAAVLLDRQWYVLSRPPDVEKVERVLQRAGVTTADRSVIANMTTLDAPEAADRRFEPEIISHDRPGTPARARHWWLAALVIAIVVPIGWYVLPRLKQPDYVVPGLIVLIALGLWFWRFAVRPTYVRMAPGMIQVVEFRAGNSKPMIRDYPLNPGTLAVITESVSQIKLTVSRGDQTDTIPIAKGKDFNSTIERLWAALLSTAPTPPLSDEELVG